MFNYVKKYDDVIFLRVVINVDVMQDGGISYDGCLVDVDGVCFYGMKYCNGWCGFIIFIIFFVSQKVIFRNVVLE